MKISRMKMRAFLLLTRDQIKHESKEWKCFDESDYTEAEIARLSADRSFLDLADNAKAQIADSLPFSKDVRGFIDEIAEELADIMPCGELGTQFCNLVADAFEAGQAFEKIKVMQVDSAVSRGVTQEDKDKNRAKTQKRNKADKVAKEKALVLKLTKAHPTSTSTELNKLTRAAYDSRKWKHRVAKTWREWRNEKNEPKCT